MGGVNGGMGLKIRHPDRLQSIAVCIHSACFNQSILAVFMPKDALPFGVCIAIIVGPGRGFCRTAMRESAIAPFPRATRPKS